MIMQKTSPQSYKAQGKKISVILILYRCFERIVPGAPPLGLTKSIYKCNLFSLAKALIVSNEVKAKIVE